MPTVAYRTIRSRRRFANYPQVRRDLGIVLDDIVKPHLIQRFEIVVKNWRHRPDFKGRKFIRPDRIWVNVFPAGSAEDVQIYKWVTGGTKKNYKIPKAGPGFLSFKTGYKPKTKPKGKIGGPGVFTGPRISFVGQVTHPGIEARKFEEVIAKDEKAWFSRTMENAWRRTIRRL